MTATVDTTQRRSLRRNAVATAGSNIARGALTFVAMIVLTRELTTSARGTFGFVANAVLLLVMIGGLGISTGLTWAKAKDGRSIPELYPAANLLGIVFGTLAGALFVLAYAVAPGRLFHGVTWQEAALVAVLVPLLLVVNHWSVIASLEDRIPEFAAATVAGAAGFLVAISIVAATTTLTATTAVLVWGATSALPLAFLIRRARMGRLWAARHTAWAVLRFGARTNVATLALILAWRVDVFLVKGFRGASELGLYAVAVSLGEIFLQVAVSFRIALTPMQGSADDRDQLVASICRVSRLMFAAGLVVSVCAIGLATPLVRLLYGESYASAGTAVAWLMPGIVALVLQGPIIDYLLVEGRIAPVTAATASSVVVNVALNALLLRHHTFVAAAIAATVCYVFSCLWCVVLFQRHTRVRWTALWLR